MNTGVLRTLLLWLMIMIIPAQAIAGAASVSCSTQSSNSLAQADTVHDHHSMGSDSGEPGAEMEHVGCVLCATSCHGISALLGRNVEPFVVVAPVRGKTSDYLLFIGQTPEPLKRPPRTAHL